MSQADLSTTLDALAPSGIVLSTEQKAALPHSLYVKKAQAGLDSIALWGKLHTCNGRDYLIAEARRGGCMPGKLFDTTLKYCFSQDGVTWTDLEPIDSATAKAAVQCLDQLVGDPAHVFSFEQEDGSEGTKKCRMTELQRLRTMVAAISAATSIVPKAAQVLQADGYVVPNRLFSGLAYPTKLDSYLHAQGGPDGPSLAADVRGLWAVQEGHAGGVTILRSLLWPGFCFFYSAAGRAWGGLYMGRGCACNDLVFML